MTEKDRKETRLLAEGKENEGENQCILLCLYLTRHFHIITTEASVPPHSPHFFQTCPPKMVRGVRGETQDAGKLLQPIFHLLANSMHAEPGAYWNLMDFSA